VCRNIKILFNMDPPVTEDEVRAAATQFVRKISGFPKPSAANQAAYENAIDEISRTASILLNSLVTNAEPKNRDMVAAKSHARAVRTFGASP
jgi:hypothetical protein